MEFRAYLECICQEAFSWCDAGTLNMPKIKGTHTAMKSGMIAAEAIHDFIEGKDSDLSNYETKFNASWLRDELHSARNVKPFFTNWP